MLRRFRKLAKRLISPAIVQCRAVTRARRVVLTFDDGPDEALTNATLDILREHGDVATFFVIGQRARAHGELLERMVEQHCEIGNHSMRHPDFSKISPARIADEIESTEQVIRDIVGHSPHRFRPPFGKLSLRLLRYLRTTSRPAPVLWSECFGGDERGSLQGEEEITTQVARWSMGPGDIVLMHDTNEKTVETLPAILQKIRESGFETATLTDMNPSDKARTLAQVPVV